MGYFRPLLKVKRFRPDVSHFRCFFKFYREENCNLILFLSTNNTSYTIYCLHKRYCLLPQRFRYLLLQGHLSLRRRRLRFLPTGHPRYLLHIQLSSSFYKYRLLFYKTKVTVLCRPTFPTCQSPHTPFFGLQRRYVLED